MKKRKNCTRNTYLPAPGVQHLRAIYVVEEGEEVEINYMLMSEEGCQRREGRQEYLR